MKSFKINAMSYAKLITELRTGPCTVAAIAEHIGLHLGTVRDYVNAMHREREVHIADYEKDALGRDNAPMWLLGPGKDAKRDSLTPEQRSERYRARRAAHRDQQRVQNALVRPRNP